MSRIIQPNGDRHYESEHGIYLIAYAWELEWQGWVKRWEIFAPEGRHFGGCHSLREDTLKDAREHIGMANNHCDAFCIAVHEVIE